MVILRSVLDSGEQQNRPFRGQNWPVKKPYKPVPFGTESSISKDHLRPSPKQLRASVTESSPALPLVVWEVSMDVIRIVEGGSFDAEITRTMGQVFDKACNSLRDFGSAVLVREIIAKRIIEAAKNGERDPARLYEQAVRVVVSIDIPSMPSVGRNAPIPADTSVAHAA